MKRPAIFFDRDNTLIACNEYLGDPNAVQLVPGAADAVARARKLGYATVIFSNQSGVARGFFDEQAVHAVNARLDEMLREANPSAVIDRHEFCPFHPEGSVEKYRQESPLRKPAPGMIHSAAERLALDLSRSWVIGDAPRDIEAGKAAGCRTILFTDPVLKASPAAMVDRKVEPDYICSTLKEAVDYVEANSDRAQVEQNAHVASDVAKRTNPVSSPSATNAPRLESLVTDILQELKRRHEQPVADFSVSKLLAGVVQVLVLFVLFLAFLNRNDQRALMPTLMFALILQTMTVALLIMGRQR